MDEMRLIVIAAGDRGVRPIHRGFVSDPIDGALEGTDAGKKFGPETYTAIELAQEMFVTKADFVCDLPDADGIAATPDDIERVTDRAWWLDAGTHSFEQPCFDEREALVVINCFAEIIAEPVDLAAEDGVQFHDAPGKFAQWQTQERP